MPAEVIDRVHAIPKNMPSFRIPCCVLIHDDDDENDDSSSSTCRLHMTGVAFQEQPLSSEGTRILKEWSDRLDWSAVEISSSSSNNNNNQHNNNKSSDNNNDNLMTRRNASVARPKTLVPLDSIEAVHRAMPPPLFPTSTTSTTRSTSYNPSTNFADACTAMDDSTGVYVYAPHPPSPPPTRSTSTDSNSRLSFECRQFPRSSGYPEDPATGIAAAALAASLRFGGGREGGGESSNSNSSSGNETVTPTSLDNDNDNDNVTFDIYQGTAMGRPSLIQVVDLQRENDNSNSNNSNSKDDDDFRISFGLQGRVEIDERCTIEVHAECIA